LYRTTSISADETQYERVDLSSYSNLLDITGNASINTGENVIILTGEGASIKVKDLPNGEENNGSAYYYVIKEVSYSLNGTKWYTVNSTSEFQPVYSGNFTNGDSTITVTNTKDLVVKKVWKKADGTEITDSTELSAMPSIKFKLYRAIKTKAKQTREDIIENGECIGTYELNSNNDYTYPFTTSNLDGYISGTEYVYAVEEVTNLTNYDVAYRSTTSDGVNVITITNKSTTTEEYVLPSTGSVGTRKLLIAGIALVGFGLAAVGIKLKRRNYEN
jgi:LPXTG-motif cell wall-anchored protein